MLKSTANHGDFAESKILATVEELGDDSEIHIKCCEIVLDSQQVIRFICDICSAEMHRLDTFLQHALQYHLFMTEEKEEEVLTAAKHNETCALVNEESSLEHLKKVSEIMEFKTEAVEMKEEHDADANVSYYDVEMLEESLDDSKEFVMEDIENIATKLCETQKSNKTQLADDFGYSFEESNVGLKLDKLADTAYYELTKCYDQDAKYNDNDPLLELLESRIEIEREEEKENISQTEIVKNLTVDDDEEVFEVEYLNDEEEEENDSSAFKIPSRKDIKKPKTTSISSSDKQYECELCKANFKNSSNLKVHRYRHLGIKPHQCVLCDKAFITSSELKLHMRSHTGERPYQCTQCGKSFTNSAHLSAHQRRHTNSRPFVCPICGKGFYDSGLLREHTRGHSDERPFVCNKCGMDFTRRKSLMAHESLHTNVKRYKCTICQKAFAQNAGLHSHMRSTHALQR